MITRDARFVQRDENPAGPHLPLEPLPGHTSRGRLERDLRRGEFAVTTELNPPDSADPVPVGDDLEAEADKAAADLDAGFDRERLVALAKAGGRA